MEPMGRIELPSAVYETAALPLSYIGKSERRELDPLPSPWEGDVLPMNYSRTHIILANLT